MKHKTKVKFHCGRCAYFCFSKSGLYKHCAITHKGTVQGSESDDLGNKDLTVNSDPAADTVARSAEIEIEVENSEFETFVLTEEHSLPEPNIITVNSGENVLTFAQL